MSKVFSLFGTIAMDGISVINKNLIDLDGKLRKTSGSLNLVSPAAAESARTMARGLQITRSMITPQEKYNNKIKELTKLLKAGAISQETFNRATDKAKQVLDSSSGMMQKHNGIASMLTGTLKGLVLTYLSFQGIKSVVGVFSSTVKAMDDLNEESQKLGINVESMKAFQYAGSTLGLTAQEMSDSLKFLNKNIADNKKEFESMGISTRDANGQIKTTETLLGEVADKFASYEDGASKTALAMELFGRSGIQMIPFLNKGSSGIKELTDEARKLGIVFSGETGKAADEFNDNMIKLRATFDGITTKLVSELLPGMLRFMRIINGESKDLIQTTEDIDAAVREGGEAGSEILLGRLEALRKKSEQVTFEYLKMNSIVNEMRSGQRSAITLKGEEGRLKKTTEEMNSLTKQIMMVNKAYSELNNTTGTKKGEAPVVPTGNKKSIDDQDTIDKLVKQSMDMRRDRIKKNTEEVERGEKVQEEAAKLEADNLKTVDELVKKSMDYRRDIQKKNTEEVERVEKEAAENTIKRNQSITQIVVDGVNNLIGVFQGYNENKLIALDQQYEKEKENIENSKLSEEEKQLKFQELDEKTAKKKRELLRRQAILEKVSGIFSIGISTAMAIMKAYSDLGPIAGTVAAVLMAIIGAAQIAVVAAKPIPAAAKGAYLPGSEDGSIIRAGENRRAEIILPMESGVDAVASRIIRRVSAASGAVGSAASSAMTGAVGAGKQVVQNFYLQVGNRYVDESGLKRLWRDMLPIAQAESTRVLMGA